MTKKQKVYLDYIPFIIIIGSAAYLVWNFLAGEIGLVNRHYTGFIFLLLTAVTFFIRHLFGVLMLGLTIILGFFGVLSYSPAINTTTFGVGDTTLIQFQPIFILWLVIYFSLSGRYFTGIASKKYWDEVKNKQR